MNDRREFMRSEAQQVIAEGRVKGFPLAISCLAVRQLLRNHGYPVPADILAFAFDGKISDQQVTNWNSPVGG
jgi:hypothetical protein